MPVSSKCISSTFHDLVDILGLVIHAGDVALGYVLEAMQAKGIGTPALTALLLKDLLTKKSNELITFAEKQTTNKLFVRLTHYGSSQVEIWRKHDMLGNSVAYGTVSRKVADAQINIEDALLALGLEPETLNKASTYIKNQGIGWENLKTLSV